LRIFPKKSDVSDRNFNQFHDLEYVAFPAAHALGVLARGTLALGFGQ